MKSFSISLKKISYADFCFWFSVIDILFLPYFKWFSISFSVPFIASWLVLNRGIVFKEGDGVVIKLMGVAMLASVIISFFYSNDMIAETALSTTIKRTIQYFIILGYYLFYSDYFRKNKVKIEPWLFYFLVFTAILAIMYRISPMEYAEFKYWIYPADSHSRRALEHTLDVYRFNGLLVDPNNIAYLIDGVLGWILINKKITLEKKIISCVLTLFIVLSTASIGGILAMGIMFFCYEILLLIKIPSYKVKKKVFLIVIVLIVMILVLLCQEKVINLLDEKLLSVLRMRKGIYAKTDNVSGGRMEDFLDGLKCMSILMLFIGTGKEGFVSEIGHLYYIALYGLPAYLGFMWVTFRIKKSQNSFDIIWMIPFFVGFTINIAIGEFKWLAIYFLLLAGSRIRGNKLYT